ncbi:GNAT family N-acetyltransferase [Pseudoroseicyclus sp. CXY001]|uniref:GNAT family N-acetyltransferase n=1 Tax=Pseudoroseicyclus sp. CXY001 TaxID=3242492 RepID=UPI0035716693
MDELSYRNLGPGDAAQLHEIASDWAVVRQLGGWPWPPRKEFSEARSAPYGGDGFVWGVFEGRRLLGTVGVVNNDLGYMYRMDLAGRGIATRAGRAALTAAFAGEVEAITGSAWADNPASARVLLKLGFQELPLQLDWSKSRREVVAIRRFRLARADWGG